MIQMEKIMQGKRTESGRYSVEILDRLALEDLSQKVSFE